MSGFLMYVALGGAYIKQSILSISSLRLLYQGKPPFLVVIFTDNPSRYDGIKHLFDIEIRGITLHEAKLLSGKHGYMPRSKIVLLKSLLAEQKGNLLFVDTDTIFLKKPDALFRGMNQGNSYLHIREYRLKSGRKHSRKLCPQDMDFKLATGREVMVNGETYMWNSGVIGLPASSDACLMDETLEMLDSMYEASPFFHVEQLCLGAILEQTGKLKSARTFVLHYWHSKSLAERTIKEALGCSIKGEEIHWGKLSRKIWIFVIKSRLNYYLHKSKTWLSKQVFVYAIYKMTIRSFIRVNSGGGNFK